MSQLSIQNILCFGDSNTWGHDPETSGRMSATERWPGVLRAALGSGFHVIEEGQPGRTTVWEDPIEGHKCGKVALPILLQSHAPLDTVIILLGTNDLKARFSLTATDIALGLQTLIEMIQGPRVVLVCPPPVLAMAHQWEPMTGAYEKSLRLAEATLKVATAKNNPWFDAGSCIESSPRDGFHWSRDSHRTLGLALADFLLSR